jgi:hypothetical protein
MDLTFFSNPKGWSFMANPPRCVSELIEDGISMKWRLDVIQKYLYNMDAKIYSFIYVGKMIFFLHDIVKDVVYSLLNLITECLFIIRIKYRIGWMAE